MEDEWILPFRKYPVAVRRLIFVSKDWRGDQLSTRNCKLALTTRVLITRNKKIVISKCVSLQLPKMLLY